MKRTPGTRQTGSLSLLQQERLSAYTLAATAAGVGVLAMAQPSQAKVVYTPIHKTIKLHQHYNLDLNHDGISDFTLQLTSFHTRNTSAFSTLRVLPAKVNAVEGGTHGTSCGGGHGAGPYAFALPKGALIGAKQPAHGKPNLMAIAGTIDGGSVYCGPWLGVTNRYLGLKFQIRGKTHFGWARISVTSTLISIASATLTGYAYETILGKAILAGRTRGPEENLERVALRTPDPQFDSLGILALGAQGVPLWRRRERDEEAWRVPDVANVR